MSEYTINPLQWFVTRQVDYEPTHFTRTNTKLTKESLEWIVNTLTGRYFLAPYNYEDEDILTIYNLGEGYLTMVPSFEDPGEAMMYTLKWS